MKLILALTTLALFPLAFVGVLYLFNTQGSPLETSTCDRIISYEDGSVVCQIIMQTADDNITVMRRI